MSGDRTVLAELASRVAPISLAETTDQAALQTRIDKKYLLPIGLLGHVLDDLGAGLRALEIDGLRVFGYESVYFDTPRLQFYRDHVQGRRLRHKVRTRRYVDSDLTMLEVKEKGGRGETVKHRTDWSPTELFRLGSGGRMFIDDLLDGEPDAASLRPSLVSRYWRATFVHADAGLRLTCDVDLGFESRHTTTSVPQGRVLVETKAAGTPSVADHILHRYAQRDIAVSKYCAGIALTHDAPANRWHRVLNRYLRPVA